MTSGKIRGFHIGLLGAAALALLTLAVFRAEQGPGRNPVGKALETPSARTQPAADLSTNHRLPSGAPQAQPDPVARPAPALPAPAGPVEAPRHNPNNVVSPDQAVEDGVSEEKIIALHGREPLTSTHPHVAPAIEVHGRHPELMMHPCVVGTAVGLDDEGRIAIIILTKADATDLPRTLEGYPVVVWKTGPIHSLRQDASALAQAQPSAATTVDPRKKYRPVPIGVSTGHFAITAGTLGCKVVKAGDPASYALSNNHVYADENFAGIGDNALQPGSYDFGKNPADRIGGLDRFVPILFSSGSTNSVDAAIVKIDPAITLLNSTPAGAGYGTPKKTTVPAALSMLVRKYGRTTGYTKGSVSAINGTVNVQYDSGVAQFVGQVYIKPYKSGSFSAGGDSGSLIVKDATWNPTGLLFAGGGNVTIANPIGAVLAALEVSIDGN